MIDYATYIDLSETTIHSSDSYFKNVAIIDSLIIIPYINIGIYDENYKPIIKYIDRCFVVLYDISYLNIYKKGILIDHKKKENDKAYSLGGINLDPKSDLSELDVVCNDAKLYLLFNSKISSDMWVPIETPNFSKNMTDESVDSLFNYREVILIKS